MVQPNGTVTYKGRRKSRPGQESLIDGKDKDKLEKAAKFHADGNPKGNAEAKKANVEKVDNEAAK